MADDKGKHDSGQTSKPKDNYTPRHAVPAKPKGR